MPEYRSVSGEIKLLEKTGEFIFPVEIWMLNDGLTRNGWRFVNLEQHRAEWAGVPILVAYVNGGMTVGDGHNQRERVDPATGETYQSFTDSTSERIVGAISDDPDDIRLESRDGHNWVVGKGFLWAWYARELTNKIVNDARQGRVMSVSIEALVSESYMDGEVEVETKYQPLGVTLLGDGVEPAVPDAHIAMMSSMESEFKELKLRAASYVEKAPDEPQKNTKKKGLKKQMRLNKQQIRDLQAKFGTDYTVLAAEQMESCVVVCLMTKAGKTAIYTMASLDESVVLDRVQEVNAQAHFCAEGCEDVLVDACDMVETVSAENAELSARLASTETELATANNTVTAMRDAENKRRVQAAKDKATFTLNAFNANRQDKVDEKILSAVTADIDSGIYTASVDKDGNWTGDKAVEEKVLSLCAAAVMEMDRKAARVGAYVWDKLSNGTPDDGSVEAFLASKGITG